MENDPFLVIDDDAFYAILTTGELPMFVVMSGMYGGRRLRVFSEALHFFQTKYHLPGLTPEEIVAITSEETDDEKALVSIRYGDFPRFITSLRLEDPNLVLREALPKKHEKAAIAVLQSEELNKEAALAEVIDHRCLPCLEYFLQNTHVENIMLSWIAESWYFDALGMKWVLENSSFVPSHALLDSYLELLENDADVSLIKLFLERITDEEVKVSYRHHRNALQNGVAEGGGDYPRDGYENSAEVTELFVMRISST